MKTIKIIFTLLIISVSLIKLNAQISEIDSLENLLQNHKEEDSIRVNLLNEIASQYQSVDRDKVYEYTKEADRLSDKINFQEGKIESLNLLGIYYATQGEYQKALEYFELVLETNQ